MDQVFDFIGDIMLKENTISYMSFFQFQIDRTTTLILFDLPSQRGDDSYCEKSITSLNSSSVIWA